MQGTLYCNIAHFINAGFLHSWANQLRSKVLQVCILTHKKLCILEKSLKNLKEALSVINRYLALRYSTFFILLS